MYAFRLWLTALPLSMLACASLGRGQSEVDSAPISAAYKNFRAQKRLLYIQNFDNRTYSPQLTGRLKDKLQLAFSRNHSLTITPEKNQADAILYGRIELYSEEPGVYDNNSMPLTYNLTIVVSTKLRPHGKGSDGDADMVEKHNVRYITNYNIGDPMYETRYSAEDRMLEGVADRIVMSTYEPTEAPQAKDATK